MIDTKWEYLFSHVKRDLMMHTVTESTNAEGELQARNEVGGIPFAEFAQIAGSYGWQMIDFHSTGSNMIPTAEYDLIIFKREKRDS